MTWATFYLICFVVGFAFSFLSVWGGGARLHLFPRLHMPHLGHHGMTHAPAGVAHPTSAHPGSGRASSAPHFFNFFTLMAFLAWFGGTGYLLTQYSSLWFLVALAVATGTGLVGAAIVFWFMAKFLLGHEKPLDPGDYELVGVLGKVSSSIREDGTGEMIFSQEGTRRVCGARSEDGKAIPKGAEVVVTRYERGLAYVRLWEDLTR